MKVSAEELICCSLAIFTALQEIPDNEIMRPSAVKMKDRNTVRNIWTDDRRSDKKNAVCSECTVPKWETIKAFDGKVNLRQTAFKDDICEGLQMSTDLPCVCCWAVEGGDIWPDFFVL